MLVEPFDTTFIRGERVLVSGPPGCGKSTLVRTMVGIWSYGSGYIEVPDGARMLFLPQHSYLPSGALVNTLSYPNSATQYTAKRLT